MHLGMDEYICFDRSPWWGPPEDPTSECTGHWYLVFAFADRNVLASGFHYDISIARIELVPIRDPIHVEVSLPLPCRRFEMQAPDETLQELPATFEVLLQVMLATPAGIDHSVCLGRT
jgi:hypothetical protein